MRYVVEKGYVTVDGASLTVTRVADSDFAGAGHEGEAGDGEKDGRDGEADVDYGSWFEVMLISYTQSKIVTTSKKVGDEVNVEIDVVGKYVEKSVGAYFERILGGHANGAEEEGGRSGEVGAPAILEKMVSRIVDEKLRGAKEKMRARMKDMPPSSPVEVDSRLPE